MVFAHLNRVTRPTSLIHCGHNAMQCRVQIELLRLLIKRMESRSQMDFALHHGCLVGNKKKSGNMFPPQMMFGFILPAGRYLFSLLETFYAAPSLCKGRRAVSHPTDPDSALQTKGWNCLECCFRALGLASSLPILCLCCGRTRSGIEGPVLDNGLKGWRRTAVS